MLNPDNSIVRRDQPVVFAAFLRGIVLAAIFAFKHKQPGIFTGFISEPVKIPQGYYFRLNRIVTVAITGTGSPFKNVWLYCHCLTAATAAASRNGWP